MKLTTLKPQLKVVKTRLAVLSSESRRTDLQTSTQRGYGYAWQKARAAYLIKHPYCVYCLKDHDIGATDNEGILAEADAKGARLSDLAANLVDHRIPHRGDMTLFWDKTNWQSMCTNHHSSTKQREEARSE